MAICNVTQGETTPRPKVWRRLGQYVTTWNGSSDGRRVEIAVVHTPALQTTEVVVSTEVLPGMPLRERFRSEVSGWLHMPLSLEDVKKALRHYATFV